MKEKPLAQDEIVLHGTTNINSDKRWGWWAETIVDLPTTPPRVLWVVTSREKHHPGALLSWASVRDAPGGFIADKSLWFKTLDIVACKRVTKGIVQYFHAQATRDLAGLLKEASEGMAAKAAKRKAILAARASGQAL